MSFARLARLFAPSRSSAPSFATKDDFEKARFGFQKAAFGFPAAAEVDFQDAENIVENEPLPNTNLKSNKVAAPGF